MGKSYSFMPIVFNKLSRVPRRSDKKNRTIYLKSVRNRKIVSRQCLEVEKNANNYV